MMKYFLAVFLLSSIFVLNSAPASGRCEIPLIPLPRKVEVRPGNFYLTIGTTILVSEETRPIGKYLGGLLSAASGSVIEVRELPGNSQVSQNITLELDPELGHLGPEGYLLEINKQGVRISAPGQAGVFYGCQTLRQLLPPTVETGETLHAAWKLPCLLIEDKPRFSWRGLMIDCSRTFQTVEYLKRLIDLLALYKLNIFHLHLTDDQGWRLEIKKYPKLISTGSKFPEHYRKKGGFYTQDQVSRIISYAAARQVTIVPEIEMPGHCLAALASYPELSCTGGPFEIYPFFKGPSIQENVYCAGNDEVFHFLKNVLAEVAGLFPGRYVHVGGDEVPKRLWKKCPRCRARLSRESLDGEEELQSYFIRRIEKFLTSKGKSLIGWDEVLEGGLAPRATVMSWRGMAGGIAAARQGHDVVMSPTSHCYLDYDHETTSVEEAYSFEPVPAELGDEQKKHILGLQGNIWTHIAVNEAAVDIQVFPRLIALAEVAWSDETGKCWEDFSRRLECHHKRLDELGVNYYTKEY